MQATLGYQDTDTDQRDVSNPRQVALYSFRRKATTSFGSFEDSSPPDKKLRYWRGVQKGGTKGGHS